MRHKLKAFAFKTYTFALSGLRINHGIVFIVSHIKLFNDMKNKHYVTLAVCYAAQPDRCGSRVMDSADHNRPGAENRGNTVCLQCQG